MSKDITPEDSIVPVFLEPWTQEQLDQLAKENARVEALNKKIADAKTSAMTKLKKLGLTDDEIAALIS